jgi:hypothetical protein
MQRPIWGWSVPRLAAALFMVPASPAAGRAQSADDSSPQPPAAGAGTPVTITCSSAAGQRQRCAADASAGVMLTRSTGTAACLLGKTWGYDDAGIWVSEGCSGEFIAGGAPEDQEKKALEHVPNVGFRLYSGEKGEIYFRLFSYVRYLNLEMNF